MSAPYLLTPIKYSNVHLLRQRLHLEVMRSTFEFHVRPRICIKRCSDDHPQKNLTQLHILKVQCNRIMLGDLLMISCPLHIAFNPGRIYVLLTQMFSQCDSVQNLGLRYAESRSMSQLKLVGLSFNFVSPPCKLYS